MVTKCPPVNSHPKKEQIMTFLDTLRIGLSYHFLLRFQNKMNLSEKPKIRNFRICWGATPHTILIFCFLLFSMVWGVAHPRILKILAFRKCSSYFGNVILKLSWQINSQLQLFVVKKTINRNKIK